jgi:hypothetical protein
MRLRSVLRVVAILAFLLVDYVAVRYWSFNARIADYAQREDRYKRLEGRSRELRERSRELRRMRKGTTAIVLSTLKSPEYYRKRALQAAAAKKEMMARKTRWW